MSLWSPELSSGGGHSLSPDITKGDTSDPHHQALKDGLEIMSFGALLLIEIIENESYIISF